MFKECYRNHPIACIALAVLGGFFIRDILTGLVFLLAIVMAVL
jgi:hypothetical protein